MDLKIKISESLLSEIINELEDEVESLTEEIEQKKDLAIDFITNNRNLDAIQQLSMVEYLMGERSSYRELLEKLDEN